MPPAPLPGHRLLASSVPGGRWPRAVSGSKRSAPRFLAFEDPTPAGVDSAHATGTSPPWREIALPTAPVVRFPLLGFQRCPSVDIRALRPVPAGSTSRWSAFGQGDAISSAPSALAVLPGFDGLLRCARRRSRRSSGPGGRCFKAASPSSGRRFSCNRPWGSCRFGACRYACRRRSTRYFGFPQCRSARIAGRKAAFAGASPVMPYPSELYSSSAAVPTVTGGRCPLAVTGRCAGRGVVANHVTTSLASAGLRAFIRCRVRSAKMLLPASSARCSPGLNPEEGGRSASARAERRSRQRAR